MARTVNCIKLGKEAEGLDFPPYPGELGQRIWSSVSKEAWAAWLKHQTRLVNENRLNLAHPLDFVEGVFESHILRIVLGQSGHPLRGERLKKVHQITQRLRVIDASCRVAHFLTPFKTAELTQEKYQRSGNQRSSLRNRLKRRGK